MTMGFDPGPDGFDHLYGNDEYEHAFSEEYEG